MTRSVYFALVGILLPCTALAWCDDEAQPNDLGYLSINPVEGLYTYLGDIDEPFVGEVAFQLACPERHSCVEARFRARTASLSDVHHDTCPLDDNKHLDLSASAFAGEAAHSLDDGCFERVALEASRQKVGRILPTLQREAGSTNWRRSLSAVAALRNFRDVAALPALRRASTEHWYPPVRLVAREALLEIDDQSRPRNDQSERMDQDWLVDYYTDAYLKRFCEGQEDSWTGIQSDYDWRKGVELVPEESIGGSGEIASVQGWHVCRGIGMRAHYADGDLIASSAGEWGGAIYFFREPELPRALLEDEVQYLGLIHDDVLVMATLAHNTSQHTNLYRIKRAGSEPVANRIGSLPESAWLMDWREDESAIVVGASGSVYQIAENKIPKVLGCVKPPPRTSEAVPWRSTPYPLIESGAD